METYGPGTNWVGSAHAALESDHHGIKQKYWINTIKGSVKIFDIDFPTALGNLAPPKANGRYNAVHLYKNVTVDEIGKQVVEFKDKDGHIGLKKVQMVGSAAGNRHEPKGEKRHGCPDDRRGDQDKL